MISDFISVENPRWTAALQNIRHDIYHFPEYVRLCAEHENGIAEAFYLQKKDSIFLAPLIIRPINKVLLQAAGYMDNYYDLSSPYGYPAPIISSNKITNYDFWRSALNELVKKARERGICSIFFRMHPLLPCLKDILANFGFLIYHGKTVSIDLKMSNEKIWQQMGQLHRRNIKKLLKENANVEIDTEKNGLSKFITLYNETMNYVGANNYYFFSEQFFLKLMNCLKDNIHLGVVRIDGEIVCMGLFTEVDGIVEYYLSGTKKEFIKKSPLKLLINYISEWAKARGNKIFHLGGGISCSADSLFKFKAKFSNNFHDFYTFRIICNESVYNSVVRVWENMAGHKADGSNGFFPAYRKLIIGR